VTSAIVSIREVLKMQGRTTVTDSETILLQMSTGAQGIGDFFSVREGCDGVRLSISQVE
jgi:hypothetical protein